MGLKRSMGEPAHSGGPASASMPAPAPARDHVALWIQATRPLYLLTSVIPALAGGLVAIGSGHADWWLLPVALVALLFIHAATDVSNDVEDYARGVDPPDKVQNSRVFNTELLSIGEGRRLYAALFFAAFVLGILICLIQGPSLLVIGVVGILGGLLYTVGPQPYKYIGLGDPAIVLLMGPLITQGAYTAVTGHAFDASAFWVGLAPGLLIASVLAANNLSDIDTDRAAGVRTLAVRIGYSRARRLFMVTLVAAVPVQIVLWATGLFDGWILLPLVLTPLLVARLRQAQAARHPGNPELETLTPLTAQLHLLFCVLLCVGVALGHT